MYYIFLKIIKVSRHLKLNIKKETRAIFLTSSKMQKTNTKLFLLLGALMVTLMCPVTVLLLTCFLQESIRHVSYEVYTSLYYSRMPSHKILRFDCWSKLAKLSVLTKCPIGKITLVLRVLVMMKNLQRNSLNF